MDLEIRRFGDANVVCSSIDFWTAERVEAYLGGVDDSDMIVLDLFSESEPQWQRTNSYYGKPWIWYVSEGGETSSPSLSCNWRLRTSPSVSDTTS